MGVNNDSMRVGNPLMSSANGVGAGGQGLAGDWQIGRLRGKKGISDSVFDLEHKRRLRPTLVRNNRLPKLGTYDFPDMISYQNPQNGWGHLDIDMNVRPNTDKPVENCICSFGTRRFGVYVHYYRSHTRTPSVNFRVIIQRVGEDEPRVK